jgi:hypothetical protein
MSGRYSTRQPRHARLMTSMRSAAIAIVSSARFLAKNDRGIFVGPSYVAMSRSHPIRTSLLRQWYGTVLAGTTMIRLSARRDRERRSEI